MARSEALDNIVNDLALKLYGMTIIDAHRQNICIDCKSPIRQENGAEPSGEPGQVYSDAGEREYCSSALCETCYDNMMGGNYHVTLHS